MSNILVAIPSMDQVPAQFAQSLAMLQKGIHNVAICFQIGSLVYDSRNHLAKQAVKMEADYIFWLDSDMVFEPDVLLKMLATMEADENINVLSGIYYRRQKPFSPVLFERLRIDEETYFCDFRNMNTYPEDKIFEAEGIGFGCVLMKADVLLELAADYQDWFSPIGRVGEDLSFCWRARKSGYKIHVDPSIQLGHCGHQIITKQFYDAYSNQLRQNGDKS